MPEMNRERLEVRRVKAKRALSYQKRQILLCAGTGCIAGGSLKLYDYFKEEFARRGLDVYVGLTQENEVEDVTEPKGDGVYLKKSGCHGFCEMGPLVQIEPEGILYTHVQLEDCDEIVHIPMSSGLSNSCETAMMLASADYQGRVWVVDNKRISWTQKQSALEAMALAQKGMDGREIKALLERYALESSIYIAVDTLKYLKKGGRVTAAGAALGTILNIKPVLQIQGEKLDAYAKVRGMKLAQTKMLEAVKNDIESRFAGEEVLIKGAYTCDEKSLSQWKKALSSAFPKHKISLDPLALSISCHIGAGSMAVVCMKIEPEADGVSFEL